MHLFLSLSTQWRRDPLSGRRTGIDYGKIAPTAELIGVDASAVFRDLQLMERAALEEFARAK